MCVERHFEDGRDAARRRTARSRLPPFPVGSTRFVEVDMGVYDTWQDDEPPGVDDFLSTADLTADGADGAVRDGDVGDGLPRRKDGGAAPDHEVRSSHTSSIVMSCAPSQRVSRPISDSCSWPCVSVAKWFPASCPTLLANIVDPYGKSSSVSLIPPGYRRSMPGAGWLVWFSKSSPSLRSPMGIHVDSPLQRQWTILDLSGSILRITATVLGAAFSSSRAVNVRLPTRILSMSNTNRPTISTHVLDTTRGEPAAGVAVTLWRLDGKEPVSQGTRETDADGRIGALGDGALTAGTYRLSFDVGAYYKKKGTAAFLQRATLDFEITDTNRRYHIPLLMSPFACSSYRGS